jgi:beta-N-acetylhexosaminidase
MRPLRLLAGTLALVVGLGGCAGGTVSPVPSAVEPAPSSSIRAGEPAGEPSEEPAYTLGPGDAGSCDVPPLAFRAAQLLLVGVPGTEIGSASRALVRGGVGGVILYGPNLVDAAQVRAFIASLQATAEVPLAVAVDEEPGRVARFATAGILPETPTARDLGRHAAAFVRSTATTIGRGLAGLGVTVDLAPVLDVTGAAAAGVIGDRSFGSDPATVTRAGVAFAEGLAAAGVAAVGKHFPGHGESSVDSHTSLPLVSASRATLDRRSLPPFAAAVKAGIPAIMVGHLLVPSIDPTLPASLSPETVSILRDDLGFDGLVMTDDILMGALAAQWGAGEAATMAVAAGVDMVILSAGAGALDVAAALVAAVQDGRLAEDRLTDAFLRVERFKDVARWAPCGP